MSIAQRLVNLSDGLSAEGILSAAKGGTGNTSGVTGTSSPTISAINYGGDDTATNPAGGATITLTGTNFASGAKVLINTTPVSVVTVVSATQITFTAPQLAAGSYILYVVNLDGSTAIAVPGIQYSGTPAWSTAAGTLGTGYETSAVSTTVAATSDSAVTYSVVSGTLPSGVVINASGTISGTSPLVAGSTTYTFTVRATDLELQDTDRQFSLTINPDVITWSSANAIAVQQDAASTTTLLASSAAGQTVSYAVDTLPDGLTLSGATVSGTATTAGTTTTTATATAAVTGKTAQQTITWTVSIAADTYFKYTTLLLNSETVATPFLADASTNNFALTSFGDTKPSNFNPYTPGYYSNYFDGNGDWLATSSTALNTSDFTIEFWMNAANNSDRYIFVLGNDWGDQTGVSLIQFQGSFALTSGAFNFNTMGTLPPANTWAHVAVVRSGVNTKVYVNGVSSNAGIGSSATNLTATQVRICNGAAGSWPNLEGYISNLRIVKGTALYTANFTPPTQPLTAISGTVLLTCQSNRFLDASTNAFAVTRNGDTKVSSFTPFVPNASYATYGSTYFDGTGDWLTVPDNAAFEMGSGNYTVEGWFYATSNSDGGLIFKGQYISGSNSWLQGFGIRRLSATDLRFYFNTTASISTEKVYTYTTTTLLNTWYHVAMTVSSGVGYAFLNGTLLNSGGMASVGAITDSAYGLTIGAFPYNIGNIPFTGYLTDVRVIKGTALYTANFAPPATPLTAVANTSLLTLQTNQPHTNSQFLDNSTSALPITRAGNSTQGSFSPYGANWSNYLPSAGSTYLFGGSSTSLALGPGNFTLEGWFYIQALAPSYSTLFDWRTNGSIIATVPVVTDFNNNGKLAFVYGNGSSTAFIQVVESSTTMPVGSWFHMALVRSGTTVTMYFNGTSVGSATSSQDFGLQNFNIGNTQSTNYTPSMYVSNVRLVKGSAVYTSAFTPSTTPLTAITNTTLLTCQSPRYVDNSINNIALSATTNVSVQKFSPFSLVTQTPLTHSVYFDGSGDYLTVSSNAAFTFGTGDFTIEGWFYVNSFGANGFIPFDNRASSSAVPFNVGVTSAGLPYLYEGATAPTGSSGITLNTWGHIAWVRTSGVLKMFVNGVSVYSAAYTVNLTGTNCTIGGGVGGLAGYFLNGSLSNLRIVKGTAVYTANFTPSTIPLTAISGTSLLACQAATHRDNSANAFTLTQFGDAAPRLFNPFGFTNTTTGTAYTPALYAGSAYFDGTGDYLVTTSNSATAFGTGDFTIEGWFYFQGTIATYKRPWGFSDANDNIEIFSSVLRVGGGTQGTLITGATTMLPNTWYHIALSRASGVYKLWLNGKQEGSSATNSWNSAARQMGIAAYPTGVDPITGYISDLRVVKGTALYTGNFVPPLAPVTATTGTTLLLNMDKGAAVDSSRSNDLETVGDAKLRDETPYAGSYYSNFFDGTGDYLNTSSATFSSTSDLTLECWAYVTSASNYAGIVSLRNSTNSAGMGLNINNTGYLEYVLNNSGGTSLYTGTLCPLNQWFHIALVRSGTGTNNCSCYLNGNRVAQFTGNNEANGAANALIIGRYYADGASQYFLNGYVSNLRYVKGTAVYSGATYTVPTAPLTAISGTSLLTCQSKSFVDNSSNNFTITRTGDVAVKSQNPFQKNTYSSMYFDGTGDGLLFPASAVFPSGAGSAFTFEFWIYPNAQALTILRPNGNMSGFVVGTTASGQVEIQNNFAASILITSSNALALGTWNHVAITRTTANLYTIYINGLSSGSVTYATALGAAQMYIGYNTYSGASMNAYLADVRTTTGAARYTANFTPPTAPLPTS